MIVIFVAKLKSTEYNYQCLWKVWRGIYCWILEGKKKKRNCHFWWIWTYDLLHWRQTSKATQPLFLELLEASAKFCRNFVWVCKSSHSIHYTLKQKNHINLYCWLTTVCCFLHFSWIFSSCCSIYIMSLVFSWIQEQGGVEQMEQNASQKSGLIYDLIDKSEGFYKYVYMCCQSVSNSIHFKVLSQQSQKCLLCRIL